MPQVIIAEDILDASSWERLEVDNLLEFLMSRYERWPNARLYHTQVAHENDVTPAVPEDIERLKILPGPWYVVIYPGNPVAIIVQLVIAIALYVISAILAPKPPTERNRSAQSPNNGLSERTNQARINGRIPDIYGTVRSTPDLISNPYKVFENHQEVEYACMVVGRGYFQIDAHEIFDGDTRVEAVPGAALEIYGPNTSPNYGSPEVTIGDPITEPMWIATKSNSVNGQVLRPSNPETFQGDYDVRFEYPNVISINPGSSEDFSDYFAPGDPLTITNAGYNPSMALYEVSCLYDDVNEVGVITFAVADPSMIFEVNDVINLSNVDLTFGSDPPADIDLGGTYTVTNVSTSTITVDDPAAVNAAWAALVAGSNTGDVRISIGLDSLNLNGTYTVTYVSNQTLGLDDPSSVNSDWDDLEGAPTGYMSPTLQASGYRWVGPFEISTSQNIDKIYANIIAMNGLYKDDGEDEHRVDVTVKMVVQRLDSYGTPITWEEFDYTLVGSKAFHSTRALTCVATPSWAGTGNRCQVSLMRGSQTDKNFPGSVVDEVKWHSLYAMTEISQSHFGNVTMIHNRTPATDGALALKERKLNLIVAKKIPLRVTGSTFTSTFHATNHAANIIAAICVNERIGRRSASEMDYESIYSSIAAVESYFGSSKAIEFCYTFDDDNMSFQDHLAAVANAVFCQAYRRGNVIKLLPELATDNSSLLFNHRNKLPGSETRSVVFGNYNDHDGVTLDWVDPEDDIIVTKYLPSDAAINPRHVEVIGVRNGLQAYFHACREWNKIQYQNTVTEFEATQEAYLLPLRERILVADNTRTGIQDGEVLSQDGLQLTLSQPITWVTGASHTIFLQIPDGTVDAIEITAGDGPNQVVLASAPSSALALDSDLFARCTYLIVSDQDARGDAAFLVSEKEPLSRWTCKVKAVNYDSRYYANDKDYINGLVDQEGNPI